MGFPFEDFVKDVTIKEINSRAQGLEEGDKKELAPLAGLASVPPEALGDLGHGVSQVAAVQVGDDNRDQQYHRYLPPDPPHAGVDN